MSYFRHKNTGDTVLEIGRAHDCTPGRSTTEQVIFMRPDRPSTLLTIDADAWATLYAPEVPA